MTEQSHDEVTPTPDVPGVESKATSKPVGPSARSPSTWVAPD